MAYARGVRALAEGFAVWGAVALAACGGTQVSGEPTETGAMLPIAAGAGFSCSRRADGPVACWGRDDDGQLGDGGGEDQPLARVVSGIPDAIGLALGERFACALRENGRLVCWGDDEMVVPTASAGALAMLGAQTHVRPVAGIANVVELAAGPHEVCARTRGAEVACWGAVGPAPAAAADARPWIGPRVVAALRGAVQLAVGERRACALGADGRASCVALEQELASARAEPVRDGAPATSLAVRGQSVCLADARAIRCHPFEGDPMTAEFPDVVALSAYDERICALVRSGRVACGWPPAWVPDVTDATRIAVGADHACARRRTGELVCWGSDVHGQLGRGTISAQ